MKTWLWELWAVVWDALCCGDWRGHLRAWRLTCSGTVTPETRWSEVQA